jgi:hypothetical protein
MKEQGVCHVFYNKNWGNDDQKLYKNNSKKGTEPNI